MDHDFPESDWRTFRNLRELALERFCKRVLDQARSLLKPGPETHHERYLDLFELLGTRNDRMASMFDNPRRSRMIAQLAAIIADGLLEPQELEQFTARTRELAESIAREYAPQRGPGPPN